MNLAMILWKRKNSHSTKQGINFTTDGENIYKHAQIQM